MTLYRMSTADLVPLPRIRFAEEGIREREDLQRLLRQRIDILGDDLLVVAEEYSHFQDARRRIDLLAVDRRGTLVVIELKRTDDGGHMELQALRYAAMVSTMTLDHLIDTYAHYNEVDSQVARDKLTAWFEEPVDELPDQVRIILVSADFNLEITSTVLWLNQQYGLDISCYRFAPYRHGDSVLLDIQQIIPLPEAAEFQVQQRRKGASEVAARTGGRPNDRPFELVLDGDVITDLARQGAVKLAVQWLFQAGYDLDKIKAATHGHRWVVVQPRAEESVQEAFRRQLPHRGGGLWFDLDIADEEGWWVMPRFGGEEADALLAALAAISTPDRPLVWRRVDSGASTAGIPGA